MPDGASVDSLLDILELINLPIIIAIQALSENPLRPLILWAG
jgi:hypothetical protein